MWLLASDITATAQPGAKSGEYTPIPPLIISNLTGKFLAIHATCSTAKASWKVAFNLVQLVSLPSEEFSPLEALRETIPLHQSYLVEVVPASTYSIRCDIPYWFPSMRVRVWEGGFSTVEQSAPRTTAQLSESCSPGSPLFMGADGRLALALAAGLERSSVCGFADSAGTAGEAISYRADGQLTLSDWSSVVGRQFLSVGSVYYLSPDSPGQMTTIAPLEVGQVVAPLGMAIASTVLSIEIQPTILL